MRELDIIADEIARSWTSGETIEPFTTRASLDIPSAYRVAAVLAHRREAGGARPAGRKIGFSNRTIWPVYGIDVPIWGVMFDDTVTDITESDEVALAGLMQPRIEPEIAFGLENPPAPEMDDAEVLACCAWVAHGVELVQSPFPGWRFGTADTIAANALHGRMLLGPRRATDPELLAPLGDFTCRLFRDGVQQVSGHSSDVLGGPLSALRHLSEVLARNPEARPLAAGEIVTTGTLTDALPIAPDERWTTELSGLDLPGIDIQFV